MTTEWKSNAALLEDWEEEDEDWDPAGETTPAEDWLLRRLRENLDFPAFAEGSSFLGQYDFVQQSWETKGELQLREFKAAFNDMVAENNTDPNVAFEDERRLAAQQLADQVFPRDMQALIQDGQHKIGHAHSVLVRYLNDDSQTPAHFVLAEINNCSELLDTTQDFRNEYPGANDRSPLENRVLENLALAFQEKGIELPALDFTQRPPGLTAAEFQLQEMQQALHAAIGPADSLETFPLREQAAKDLVQGILDPEQFSKWQDPEGYFRHAAHELASYLRNDPDSSHPATALEALAAAGRRFPEAFGLNPEESDRLRLEHLLESPAAEYREPSPEAILKLAEFTEKLLDFHNDPETTFERRQVRGFGTDSFPKDQPETLLLKALDIANQEMTFGSLAERREFAEHAAAGLLDQVLGGDPATRRLLAGSHVQLEPGYVDSLVQADRDNYAAAENDFKELLTDLLATYQPAWSQHIDESDLPQRFNRILQALNGLLEGDSAADPEKVASDLAWQREHFSRDVEARAYDKGISLPHPQHEPVPDFTMARYTEPPHYLQGRMDETRFETWRQAYGRAHWDAETHALIGETLTALTERYPGTAMHKDGLSANFPTHCLNDLKTMFQNQAFASAEHRRQEAAIIAEAVSPADDPLLREWNQSGWQAAAQANRLLQDYLNRDSHDDVSYYRIADQTARARQARQEAQEFLTELAAVQN